MARILPTVLRSRPCSTDGPAGLYRGSSSIAAVAHDVDE